MHDANLPMDANSTNNNTTLIYPELSYLLVGICFHVHNELGRFAREKQYGDLIEQSLKDADVPYRRELRMGPTGNILDFLIDGKIVLELKTKELITKEDYFQLQRYLQSAGLKLGLLINFRSRYLRPKRVIRTDRTIRTIR